MLIYHRENPIKSIFPINLHEITLNPTYSICFHSLSRKQKPSLMTSRSQTRRFGPISPRGPRKRPRRAAGRRFYGVPFLIGFLKPEKWPIECRAPKIAKLVYTSNNYMVYGRQITIVIYNGVYKPTYNCGASHCRNGFQLGIPNVNLTRCPRIGQKCMEFQMG